jgi:LysM repeat protein
LRGSDRYAFLFKLAADDYRGWAYGLKKAGYATNTRYPEILIKNIEQYNLNQYTLSAMGDIPKYDASAFEDDKEVPGTPETPQKENIVSESVTMLDQEDKVIGINGCKAVMGKKGVSLLVIALKNNVDLNKLLRFNELAEDGMLMNDQPVFLEKKAKTGEKDFHLVQKGESLYDISQKNGIQLQYLLDYNKLTNKDYPAAGSALWLKPLAALKEIPQKIQKKGIHIVQEKEGLYSIAKKYNVSMKQLKDWNKLVSDDLKMGMELRVAE